MAAAVAPPSPALGAGHSGAYALACRIARRIAHCTARAPRDATDEGQRGPSPSPPRPRQMGHTAGSRKTRAGASLRRIAPAEEWTHARWRHAVASPCHGRGAPSPRVPAARSACRYQVRHGQEAWAPEGPRTTVCARAAARASARPASPRLGHRHFAAASLRRAVALPSRTARVGSAARLQSCPQRGQPKRCMAAGVFRALC